MLMKTSIAGLLKMNGFTNVNEQQTRREKNNNSKPKQTKQKKSQQND